MKTRFPIALLLVALFAALLPAAQALALDYDELPASELYKLTTPDNAQKVRRRAVIEIGNRKQADGKAVLVKLLADKDPVIQEEAIRSLAHRMSARDAAPEIEKLLKDKNPKVVEKAIEGLVDLEYQQALPELKDLANTADDPHVARAAQKAVKHFQG